MTGSNVSKIIVEVSDSKVDEAYEEIKDSVEWLSIGKYNGPVLYKHTVNMLVSMNDEGELEEKIVQYFDGNKAESLSALNIWKAKENAIYVQLQSRSYQDRANFESTFREILMNEYEVSIDSLEVASISTGDERI